jgi:excisionase family DNA binding protein
VSHASAREDAEERAVERLYYSVFEVAIMIAVPEASVRRLIAEGALPGRRLAGRVLVPRDELMTVLRDLPSAAQNAARERERREW